MEDNIKHVEERDASELSGEFYTHYAKYVVKTRALPSIYDGFKAVHRRLTFAGHQLPNKLTKSVNIIGTTIKYHPHGDQSIESSLITVTSKTWNQFPLFDGRGNWGGPGYGAASTRYTEAKLSEFAKKVYCQLIDTAEWSDGEAGNPEPEFLPAMLPYCLLVGSSGIGVGLSSNIFALNPLELTDYYIGTLEGTPSEELKIPRPNFGDMIIDQPREEVEEVIRQGHGRLVFQGIVTQEDVGKFVIEYTPPELGIEKVIKKVQKWIDQDWLDYINESTTTPRHVFEIVNPNKLSEKELLHALNRATHKTKSYNFVLADKEKAVYCGLDHIVNKGLGYLKESASRKFQKHLASSTKLLQVLNAITEFKKSGKLEHLPEMTTSDVVKEVMELGFSEEISKEVPKKPISYLTRDHGSEMKDLEDKIKVYQLYVDKPEEWLLDKYKELREYLEDYCKDKKFTYYASEKLQEPRVSFNKETNTLEIREGGTGVNCGKVLLVEKGGTTHPRVINSVTESNVELDIPDIVELVSPENTYIVYILKEENPKSDAIFVAQCSNFNSSRNMIRTEFEVVKVITTSDEVVKIKGQDNKVYDIPITNIIKSRFSYANPLGFKYKEMV
ncbi:DNA topoisomerase IV subunit A [Bacillus phage vB_BceM-HSE3]|nr:DNA topoisomerase IV subunit A [Bacillus phage vB_BceM-HSE3]